MEAFVCLLDGFYRGFLLHLHTLLSGNTIKMKKIASLRSQAHLKSKMHYIIVIQAYGVISHFYPGINISRYE